MRLLPSRRVLLACGLFPAEGDLVGPVDRPIRLEGRRIEARHRAVARQFEDAGDGDFLAFGRGGVSPGLLA